MAKKHGLRPLDRFVMNNCKIANELRKYRDLAGCLNQVSLSGERGRRPSQCADYAEYFISQDLSYLDMVTANAAYTLLRASTPQMVFQADTVAQIMSGRLDWRIAEKRRGELEARLQKLAQTQLYILADHDHQVEQDLYEGQFLPVEWEQVDGKLKFRFLPERPMPLYQYAEHHRQLIEAPLSCLWDDPKNTQVQRSNNDRMLLLRHYLLQELAILRYDKNKVEEQHIRLLKQDREGNELGLLWILGIQGQNEQAQVKDLTALAKKVQRSIQQLLDSWRERGYLDTVDYQMLSPEDGFGVRLFAKP